MKLKSVTAFLRWELIKRYRIVQNVYDRYAWRPWKKIDIKRCLDVYGNNNSFYFIQIGANDGITGDKLNYFVEKYKWKGILVEPVPHIFKRLKENYKQNSNLLFENSAIGKKNGSQLFYSISESNAKGIRHSEILNGNGLDQLGSFDKMTILKHANMIPHFESFIKEIYVPTMTIEDLLKKYGVTNVNLLQIDTEGYDYEILNQEPFASVKPKILIFEHQHITRLQYKTLINKFRKFGYQFFVSGWDTICFLR